jgi:glycogenin
MDRPDLISTFTKIELWRQTQYRQIVYIDADVVAIRAPNELLTLDADFAAAPDIGWPDCFNSGVMVLRPNMGDYYSLLALAQRGISFDGADQGLLNMHFRDWERLSFTYNCAPNSSYQYIPAYRHFQSSISMIHFIGRDKPWTLGRESKHTSGVYGELLGRWWATYDKHYRTSEKPATGAATRNVPQQHDKYYRTSEKSATGAATRTVPQRVAGEQYLYQPTYPSMQPPATSVAEAEPEVTTTEAPMGDQLEPIEKVTKEDFEPTPTVQQRKFSAPQAEWDPSR